MDILYQFYFDFLKKLGLNEALINIFWYIFPFVIAVVAFFIIANLVFFLDKKLYKIMNETENLSIMNLECIKSNRFSLLILITFSIFLWGLIPYSNKYFPINTDVGVFIFFVSLVGLLFSLLVSRKNKDAFLRFEIICGLFSFMLPIFISQLSIVFLSSSFNLNEIALAQTLTQNAIGWMITPSVAGFFVYILGVVFSFSFIDKSLNISGFCLYNISNCQIKALLLCYYSLLFILAAYGVCLFLGGYLPPLGFYVSELFNIHYVLNLSAVYLEQIFWLLLKSLLVVIFIMGLKIKILKVSKNSLINFSWFVLVPVAILNVIICMGILALGGK